MMMILILILLSMMNRFQQHNFLNKLEDLSILFQSLSYIFKMNSKRIIYQNIEDF